MRQYLWGLRHVPVTLLAPAWTLVLLSAFPSGLRHPVLKSWSKGRIPREFDPTRPQRRTNGPQVDPDQTKRASGFGAPPIVLAAGRHRAAVGTPARWTGYGQQRPPEKRQMLTRP